MKSARTLVTAGRLRFLLLALPLLLLVGAAGPRACPAIDVQCGDVLDIDYAQYRLNGDLVCGGRLNAITITAEGVHFNLAGYAIRRSDEPAGFLLTNGIAVRGANAHINGGSIEDFNGPLLCGSDCAAIRLFDAAGARINGMSLHNNTVGIYSGDNDNADGARIHGNDIKGNLRIGIALFGAAEGAEVTGNDLSDTGGFTNPDAGTAGYIGASDDVSVIGNVANNCEGSGILLFGGVAGNPPRLFGPPERNTIRDNATLDNGLFGIELGSFSEEFRPRDNLIQSNTSFGNGIADLTEEIIFVGPAADCLNTWQDNDFDVAEPDCIE